MTPTPTQKMAAQRPAPSRPIMSVTALPPCVNPRLAYPIVMVKRAVPMVAAASVEPVKIPRCAKPASAFSVSLSAVVWSVATTVVAVRVATVDWAKYARAGAVYLMVPRLALPTLVKTAASAPKTPRGSQSANVPMTSLATTARRRWLFRTVMST